MKSLRSLRDNMQAIATVGMLLGMVVFVLVAALVYPLIGDRVTTLTDNTSASYVGADSADMVGMIPLFYWLAVALTVIGVAIYAIKEAT